MKTEVKEVTCIKEYKGLHVGEEIQAIYTWSRKHDKFLYHIAGAPVTDKIFNEHFKID